MFAFLLQTELRLLCRLAIELCLLATELLLLAAVDVRFLVRSALCWEQP